MSWLEYNCSTVKKMRKGSVADINKIIIKKRKMKTIEQKNIFLLNKTLCKKGEEGRERRAFYVFKSLLFIVVCEK